MKKKVTLLAKLTHFFIWFEEFPYSFKIRLTKDESLSILSALPVGHFFYLLQVSQLGDGFFKKLSSSSLLPFNKHLQEMDKNTHRFWYFFSLFLRSLIRVIFSLFFETAQNSGKYDFWGRRREACCSHFSRQNLPIRPFLFSPSTTSL